MRTTPRAQGRLHSGRRRQCAGGERLPWMPCSAGLSRSLPRLVGGEEPLPEQSRPGCGRPVPAAPIGGCEGLGSALGTRLGAEHGGALWPSPSPLRAGALRADLRSAAGRSSGPWIFAGKTQQILRRRLRHVGSPTPRLLGGPVTPRDDSHGLLRPEVRHVLQLALLGGVSVCVRVCLCMILPLFLEGSVGCVRV